MKLIEMIGKLKQKMGGYILRFAASKRLSERTMMMILYVVVIILLNLISLKLHFRFDLTENGAYSLSAASREVIASLESPLTLRVFFTEDLPAPYNNVKRYLTDILEEYSESGNRNFRYVFIDPAQEKNKKELDDYGVRAVKISEYKHDQISVREAYMAIALEHEDLLERVDSLTSPEGIEYRITSLIRKMTNKVDALHRITTPINVTLFASKNLPEYGKVVRKVAEQFEKVNVKNYRKLQFRGPLDPLTDPDAQNMAKMYGVPKMLLRDRTGRSEEIALGLVVDHAGRFETVHLLGRSIFSMYSIVDSLDDIMNSIVGSIIGINPVIGYTAGHDELSFSDIQEGAANFRPLIPEMYDFQQFDLAKDDIPDSIQTLVINGPKREFTDAELFRIDQFLMKGRSVIVFLDAFKESERQAHPMFRGNPSVIPNETGLEQLLASYGVSITPQIVLDMNCLRYRGDSLYMVPQIGVSGLDRENEITKYLKRVYFVKSSPVTVDGAKLQQAGIRKTVLATSSPDSWLVTNIMPWTMNPPAKGERSKHDLGVLLAGQFESHFKGKALPKMEEPAETIKAKGAQAGVAAPAFLERSVRPGKLMVIGTSEITRFDYQVDPREFSRPNAVFIQNIIDYMNGNYGVPEMRSKGQDVNPLREDNLLASIIRRVFNTTPADAVDWAKLILKVFNLALLPAIVVALTAGGMYAWRRRRKARIIEQFAPKEEV